MGNKKFTFKQLLTNYKVEIPVLQRDYVQGNFKDKKAQNIREDFVSDLTSHLVKTYPGEMTLDFIYGKIIDDALSEEQQRREEHLESLLDTVSEYAKKSGFEIYKHYKKINEFVLKDTFVPFDGQQRLTTLFLLHFLVYTKQGQDLSFLRQFSYKTRESSRDFLEALLNNAFDFTPNEVWEMPFIQFIKDRNWFYDFWKYDPTVMGMIVMLEAFREKLTQQEDLDLSIQTIQKNLDATNILTFDFLDIDEHQLDDILYVKMNASGKELTDFEKFKSWLIEYVEDRKNNISVVEKNWETKLDTIWYDLFWEVDPKKTDELLYQFIKRMLLFKFCCRESSLLKNEEERQNNQKLKKIVYDTLTSKESLPFRFYIEHKLIDAESLDFIFFNLDALTTDILHDSIEAELRKVWNKTFNNDWLESKQFRHYIISSLGSLNLFHQTFLFSIFFYIESIKRSEGLFSAERFFDWLRIGRNLIYNSRIDDAQPFFSALQAINNVGPKCLAFQKSIADPNFIEYFPQRQRLEEYQKNAEPMAPYQEDFVTAENHHYFYGQIGFIIDVATKDGVFQPDKFKQIYNELNKIFCEENLNHKEHLISRALLTIDDAWMPDMGSDRYLFCLPKKSNSRDRDENWRKVFNDDVLRNSLLQLTTLTKSNKGLDEIIQERKSSIEDWRRLILEYPLELDYCKQGLINYGNDGNHIRLLGQSRLSHYHRELRTSVLFNYILKPEFELPEEQYREMKSDDNGYICIKIGDKEVVILFDIKKSHFKYYERIEDTNIEISGESLKNIDELFHDLVKSMDNYIKEPYIL